MHKALRKQQAFNKPQLLLLGASQLNASGPKPLFLQT